MTTETTYEQKLIEWWREHGQELLRLLATQPKPSAETLEDAIKHWNDSNGTSKDKP